MSILQESTILFGQILMVLAGWVLKDEDKMKCTVALTPTWNESAWFSDYVLPMGHASERHDLMSQETHSNQWVSFRQPVLRVAKERPVKK